MKLNDIPQFIDTRCNYQVDISWVSMESFFSASECPIEMCPVFQRGHIWTPQQQTAYIEYRLRGGRCSNELIFASEGFVGNGEIKPWYLVDGLQRLTAVRKFLADEVRAFGLTLHEYEDHRLIRRHQYSFKVRVIDTDLNGAMQLYIDLNAGGTPHTSDEISRVRNLLKALEKTK